MQFIDICKEPVFNELGKRQNFLNPVREFLDGYEAILICIHHLEELGESDCFYLEFPSQVSNDLVNFGLWKRVCGIEALCAESDLVVSIRFIPNEIPSWFKFSEIHGFKVIVLFQETSYIIIKNVTI